MGAQAAWELAASVYGVAFRAEVEFHVSNNVIGRHEGFSFLSYCYINPCLLKTKFPTPRPPFLWVTTVGVFLTDFFISALLPHTGRAGPLFSEATGLCVHVQVTLASASSWTRRWDLLRRSQRPSERVQTLRNAVLRRQALVSLGTVPYSVMGHRVTVA